MPGARPAAIFTGSSSSDADDGGTAVLDRIPCSRSGQIPPHETITVALASSRWEPAGPIFTPPATGDCPPRPGVRVGAQPRPWAEPLPELVDVALPAEDRREAPTEEAVRYYIDIDDSPVGLDAYSTEPGGSILSGCRQPPCPRLTLVEADYRWFTVRPAKWGTRRLAAYRSGNCRASACITAGRIRRMNGPAASQ